MPALLLPILNKYWKPLLIGGAVFVLGGYIWLLRHELADCELHVRMFKSVQARNEEAIKAQNRAIRLMWLRQKAVAEREKKAEVASAKIMAKALVESRKPIHFTQKATCDQDVEEIFQKVRGLR